jgi:phosphatidylserine/phosphatidylglycerophosphate/cardiolipin synthase-like enzyme
MKRILLLVLFIFAGCSPVQADLTPPSGVGEKQILVMFPRNGQYPQATIISLYQNASKTIDLAMYALEDGEIVKSLTEARERGVKIRVITDRWQSTTKYQKVCLSNLMLYSIPVMINIHPNNMNLKMSVVDGKFATTGSYDYTLDAAGINDEMFIMVSEPTFVKYCQNEFDRMWYNEKGFAKYPQ